jgi:hypothetical protein
VFEPEGSSRLPIALASEVAFETRYQGASLQARTPVHEDIVGIPWPRNLFVAAGPERRQRTSEGRIARVGIKQLKLRLFAAAGTIFVVVVVVVDVLLLLLMFWNFVAVLAQREAGCLDKGLFNDVSMRGVVFERTCCLRRLLEHAVQNNFVVLLVGNKLHTFAVLVQRRK